MNKYKKIDRQVYRKYGIRMWIGFPNMLGTTIQIHIRIGIHIGIRIWNTNMERMDAK